MLGTLAAIIIFGIVAGYTIQRSHLRTIETSIRNNLLSKGRTLAVNNSLALRQLVEDNAFAAIRELVQATVSADNDIVRGIFMDSEMRPWVTATKKAWGETPATPEPLGDSLSRWAAHLTEPGFMRTALEKQEIIEFAAPVIGAGQRLGTIRYSLSTVAVRCA